MKARIISDILLIICSFVLPWWFVLFAVLILSFVFDNFYEAMVFGIILDSLYGSSFIFENIPLVVTSIFTLFIIGVEQFKKQLNV